MTRYAPAGPLAGRYALGAELGRGSTATVHRARDAETGDDVAVKVFRTESVVPSGRDRREIDILTGLRHPGLVGFRDAGTADGHLFVVMDLVEGRSLAAALRAGPLRATTVAVLGARLAAALAHVHARGIVHRDVKPANILLDERGRPLLADFGIARLDGATRMTETGVVVGTAAYMAPEQVRGTEVGPPADIYALGLVLLEALTGLREYPGSALEAAVARLHRPPKVPTGLPAGLADALEAMTATDPTRRPDAAELAGRLDAAARAAAGTPTGRYPARKRARPVAAAAVGVLVAGVVGGWFLVAPDGSLAATPASAPPAGSAPMTTDPQSPAAQPQQASAPVAVAPAAAPVVGTAVTPAPPAVAPAARPAPADDAAAEVEDNGGDNGKGDDGKNGEQGAGQKGKGSSNSGTGNNSGKGKGKDDG
jgi:hypothetical protein